MINFQKIEQLIEENKQTLGTWYDHFIYSILEKETDEDLNFYKNDGKNYIEALNTTVSFPINGLIGFENKHILEAVKVLTDKSERYKGYSECWNNQISEVLVKLHKEFSSRRAIIQFIGGENPSCLQTVQFLIRKNKLHIVANFRSQEIIEFAVYDICLLKYMGESLLGLLRYLYPNQFSDLVLGELTVNSALSHIIIG